MPKKIDPQVKERCVRQVLEHLSEYSSLTAAAEVVARREGLGKETVRRWVVQAQVDGGQRQGATSEDLAEIKELKAKVRRLEEDNEILRRPRFSSPGSSTPATADRGDHRRDAVRGPCGRVGLSGPALSRAVRSPHGPTGPGPAPSRSARTISDAVVIDQVRDLAWQVDHEGLRRMTPEGLYGRRKMTALVRRTRPDASPGSVDRAMRSLSLQGIRRSKGLRTTIPAKDGRRAGNLLDRNFTAAAPNRTWVMDFTYVRTWAGFVYAAFVLDVYAQKIVAWNVAATKAVELVDAPVRMALWQRDREGHPVVRGELIGHEDAGSQYTSILVTDHLADEGIRPSIGTVGDAYDNALMECIIGLYKTECIRTTVFQPSPYRTIAEVEYATAGWVDWYNNRRLHSSLGTMSPIEFEQAHYATLNREPHPA